MQNVWCCSLAMIAPDTVSILLRFTVYANEPAVYASVCHRWCLLKQNVFFNGVLKKMIEICAQICSRWTEGRSQCGATNVRRSHSVLLWHWRIFAVVSAKHSAPTCWSSQWPVQLIWWDCTVLWRLQGIICLLSECSSYRYISVIINRQVSLTELTPIPLVASGD